MKEHDSADTVAILIDSWGKIHDVMVSSLMESLGRDMTLEILCAGLRKLGKDEMRNRSAENAVEIARVLMEFEGHFGMEPVLSKAEVLQLPQEIGSNNRVSY